MPLPGASTSCSPSSIALARTTSSSAVRRATLPISRRYIRTESSIPSMSAESAPSPSAAGTASSLAPSPASSSCWSPGSWVIVVLRRIGRGDASAHTRWHLGGRPVRNETRETPLHGIPSRQDIEQKAGGRLVYARGPNRLRTRLLPRRYAPSAHGGVVRIGPTVPRPAPFVTGG